MTVAVGMSIGAATVHAGGTTETTQWPQWRGPGLDGSSQATGLPTQWGDSENIAWKVPMPSWSGATSIIWDDRIFVTSPSAPDVDGKKQDGRGLIDRNPGGNQLLLICLNKSDGSERWRRELGGGNRFVMKQNMSSPSPVTDGQHVWALTGTGVFACFDMDGKEIWRRDIQKDYGKFGLNHGFASSPLLLKDKLVIPVLHGMKTDDPSYLFAVDKLTGKTLWKVERWTDAPSESPDAYTTPTVLQYGDHFEIIVSGGDYITAHDPADGKEVWRTGGLNPNKDPYFRSITSPLAYGDMVYATSRVKPMLAVRSGGKGNVEKSHIAWKSDQGPDVPTPVCDGKYLYVLRDKGFMLCHDAKTGKVIWGPERIAQGTYSASPLLADGKIYVISEKGVATVLKTGPKFKVLAENTLNDGWVLASFAVSGNRLYLRGSQYLYCIGK